MVVLTFHFLEEDSIFVPISISFTSCSSSNENYLFSGFVLFLFGLSWFRKVFFSFGFCVSILVCVSVYKLNIIADFLTTFHKLFQQCKY